MPPRWRRPLRWMPPLLLAAALVPVAVATGWQVPPRPCKARFELVQKGMGYAQVVGTVGGLTGDYTTNEYVYGPPLGLGYWDYESRMSDDGLLLVQFDDGGRAEYVQVFP